MNTSIPLIGTFEYFQHNLTTNKLLDSNLTVNSSGRPCSDTAYDVDADIIIPQVSVSRITVVVFQVINKLRNI